MASYTRICGPCDRDQEENDALFWCNTCDEGLCQNCSKEHKKNRASSNHSIILAEDLTTEFKSFLSLNDDLCEKHDGKIISLYCVSHDNLCCSVCLQADHRQCADIVTVEDVAKSATQNTAFDELQTRIDDVNYILGIILKEKYANINSLEKQAQARGIDILKTKDLIMCRLNKTEISATEEINYKKESCIKKLMKETGRIQKKQSKSKALIRDLKTLEQIGSFKHVFIAVKRLDVMLHDLEQELQNDREALLKKYELTSPSPAMSASKSFASYGESSIITSIIEGVPNLKNYHQRQIFKPKNGLLQLMETIDLSNISSDNLHLCYFELHDKIVISGSAYMFAVAIQSNRLEKVDLDLVGFPWFVTKYDEDHVLVAIIGDRDLLKINILSLSIICKINLPLDYKYSSQVICVCDHVVICDRWDKKKLLF